ncbi:hypothetical protein IKL45_00295 [Candidatus Saccharibacteria bacterium]|nr:hypothetical protein [Candidatus Saccharibacteria bacterium]MBR6122545.1 hypothetical protein [Candidatus Saccharibacteria bacterium]
MKRSKSIIWGIAILALGLFFGGKALGLFQFELFFDGWWTLFIIVPSLMSLCTERFKFGSLFMLALGVILLLAAQNVFSWDVAWKVILAAFFIVIGLSIIFKNLFIKDVKAVKDRFTVHVDTHGLDHAKEAEVKEPKKKSSK